MGDDTLTRAEEDALTRARRSVDARGRSRSGTRAASASPGRGTNSGRTKRGRTKTGSRRRSTTRSATLDTARGVLLAAVAVLVIAGDPAGLPAWLRPAPWHGFGGVDLLPAAITVVVGVSLAFQLAAHGTRGAGWWTARLGRRVVLLVGIGLLLSWLHTGDPETVRVTGPLTRLAVGGVIAWVLAARLSLRTQVAVAVALSGAHWFLLGRGVLGMDGAVARFEHGLLGSHSVTPIDPDGLVALAPTVVAILGGVWIGQWLRDRPTGPATVVAFALAGLYTLVAAFGWAQILPVNSVLWTTPTLLLGAGVVLVLLALSHLLVEVLPSTRALRWLTAVGAQALPVYGAAVAVAALRERTFVGGMWDGLHGSLATPLLGRELGTLLLAGLVAIVLARAAAALTRRGTLLRA